MSLWFDCESAWDGFLDTLPHVITVSELVPARRDVVFDAITVPSQHVAWADGMREVRWLTPPPHRIGTERRVVHAGMRVDVRVAAFEPPGRFAFYAVRCGQPIVRQFMEEFTLTEEPFGTRVQWRIGWRLRLPLRALEAATAGLGREMFGSILGGLRRHFADGKPGSMASTSCLKPAYHGPTSVVPGLEDSDSP